MSSTFNFSCSKLLNECNNNPSLPKTFMSNDMPQFIKLFDQFEQQAHLELKHYLEKRTYRHGEYLRHANQHTQCLWLIESGIVIEEVTLDEQLYINEFRFAGEFIGNYANHCLNLKNACGLVAYRKVDCWIIPSKKIDQWAIRYASMARLVELFSIHLLNWQKNELSKIKSLPCEEAFTYLHQYFPQYVKSICKDNLASFLRCSTSTYKRYCV